jgi:hypothetical protein
MQGQSEKPCAMTNKDCIWLITRPLQEYFTRHLWNSLSTSGAKCVNEFSFLTAVSSFLQRTHNWENQDADLKGVMFGDPDAFLGCAEADFTRGRRERPPENQNR